MTNSLWGDDFTIVTPQKNQKSIIDKATKPKKVTTVKEKAVRSSKKITTAERLSLIEAEVNRILGVYRNQTIVIRSRKDFESYINSAIKNSVIAIDTETNNSLVPLTCKIMGLCIYTPGCKNAYIPINHENIETGELLENQLTEQDIHEQLERLNNTNIIMHNGKFDYEVIKCTCGNELKIYWDTLIASRLLNENERANLKQQYISKIDPSIEKYSIEQLFEGIEYSKVSPELFALYAATDAYMTYKLYEWQKKQFDIPDNIRIYKLFREIEMPMIPVLASMELSGISIDTEYAKRLSIKYHKKLDAVDKKIEEALHEYDSIISEWRKTPEANFKAKKLNKKGEETYSKSKNEQLSDPVVVTSPTQLAILFYDVLKCPILDKKTPRGTGEEFLEKMDYPICKLILEKRGLEKLIGTYIDKLPECVLPQTGRIHCHFNQIGADTGRQSCIAEGTMISMPGGDKPIESIKPGNIVYCYDVENNRLKLSKVKNVYNNGKRDCIKIHWRSKYNHELMGNLVCTPDHMVRTVNGWKEAQELTPEDSILYVHRRNYKTGVALYGNFGQGNEEEHVWIKENYFNKQGSNYHIHHIDGNRQNNDPSNLSIVTPTVHTATHLSSKLPSNNHYCGRYNYTYEDLISMAEKVNWELTKIQHDFTSVLKWYKYHRINYILKYTESYSKRSYAFDQESKNHNKPLHLPLNKSNLTYALDLSNGNIVDAASYFGVTTQEFESACNQFELLSNHSITSIEWLNTPLTVYDLEIENYHNFIANELCVHNCSDPNLQNIPSKNKDIRMMFCAGYNESETSVIDNYIIVDTDSDILTTSGWKNSLDIVPHDIITEENETAEVVDVLNQVETIKIMLKEVVQ